MSSEALAAGARVLPGPLRPEGRKEGQAEPLVQAGPSFAGVWTRCRLGWGGLRRGRGVRSQLERRRDGVDASAWKQQEEDEEKRGVRRLPHNRWNRGAPHPHPDDASSVTVSLLGSELLMLVLAGLSRD